ncbi:MAG: polyprenyl synthetase family protein [Bacteroidetes bacterium]|nr:polyprenyl synthetase family protein [Bacteroidota bacterium]
MTLNEVLAPIHDELEVFKEKFKGQLTSKVKLVDTIARYVVRSRGKHLRPALVLLCGKMCGGEVTERSYRAAITIELIHTATLVHDDVVDGADMRRGMPSINAIWKNKMAVLMGDYLLANALISIVDIKSFDAMMLLSMATKRASQGELMQIDKSRKLDIDEETYLQMVGDKTGALIAAACELGGITTTEKEDDRAALRSFGEAIGVAFQIKDDLFDYEGHQIVIGKTKGRDLKEHKITLPLIHAFSNAPRGESKKILRMIKNDVSRDDIKKIIQFTDDHGGLAYAKQRLADYSNQALGCLDRFKDSDAKEGLKKFVQFNKERNK